MDPEETQGAPSYPKEETQGAPSDPEVEAREVPLDSEEEAEDALSDPEIETKDEAGPAAVSTDLEGRSYPRVRSSSSVAIFCQIMSSRTSSRRMHTGVEGTAL